MYLSIFITYSMTIKHQNILDTFIQLGFCVVIIINNQTFFQIHSF